MQTATITTRHNRNTKQTPKPQQKPLNRVETPIPESLLRQSVPIKMWVAAEKLKEKNFREEQKGRIRSGRRRTYKHLHHLFGGKGVGTFLQKHAETSLPRCGFAPTCIWYHANESHICSQRGFAISPTHNEQKMAL